MNRYALLLLLLLPHPYGLLGVVAVLMPLVLKTWEHQKVRASLRRLSGWTLMAYRSYRAGCWKADPRSRLGRAVLRFIILECLLVGALAVVYGLIIYPGDWFAWKFGYRAAPTAFYTAMFGVCLFLPDFAFGRASKLRDLL